ncbi:MAG: DUF4124 domain-containing protein [Rhodanobacteraceae bacterium]|nr:DUF4124 domain-containing protein [Rhodanobacteraceae bacterium]MBP9155250.1 DUF4124 domain-containing protein [Xanthomonadales bacterium]HQW81970.1 DUF4124 domain-containing protein [Pseudomonadota bacterium]
MRRLLLLSLLACVAMPGHAGKLFACRDVNGQMSFVDHGCPGASERHEVAVSATTAADKSHADADSKQIAAWEKASRGRLPVSLGGAARFSNRAGTHSRNPQSAGDDGCTNAKAARAKAERERSFEIGFDERRRLSDAVLSACGLR